MIAYKGFKKDLTCRGFQYEENKIFSIDEDPVVCKSGFHYCSKLVDCFNYYANIDSHVFAEVEILGKVDSEGDKSATNKIKILRVLGRSEVNILSFIHSPQYKLLKYLNSKYNIIIGGSVSLFLQGIYLNRNLEDSDLDIIMPYFQLIESNEDESIKVSRSKALPSSNDFGNQIDVIVKGDNGIKQLNSKIDLKVDPYQEYINVAFDNTVFKVSPYLETLKYKIEYAQKGSDKHIADLEYLIKHNEINK